MAAEGRHKSWGVEDFERYHSGKMTEAEMHALEKAALDDPFLEDALEGYAFTTTPVADIDALKEKLWPKENDGKAPVIWYRQKAVSQLFKAAAVIIIFGGLGWLIFNNTGSKKDNSSATVASLERKDIANVADSISSSLYKVDDSTPVFANVDKEMLDAKKQQSEPAINGLRSVAPAQGTIQSMDVPYEKDDMARNESRWAEKAAIIPSAAPRQNGLNNQVPYQKDKAAQDSVSYKNLYNTNNNLLAASQVRGKVVDNAGKPVPFATIKSDVDRRQAILTDANGNFVINSDAASNNNNNPVKIEASAIGYDQANTVLNNNSSNNTIVLNQSQNTLSETVVTNAYKAKKSVADNGEYYAEESKGRKETYQWNGNNTRIRLKNADPLEGWPYFYYVMNDSIQNNTILNKQKGRVVLQFETDSSGAVKNVVVKKSLNDAADNAALRMLYRSPVLRVKNAKSKGEATLKLGY